MGPLSFYFCKIWSSRYDGGWH